MMIMASADKDDLYLYMFMTESFLAKYLRKGSGFSNKMTIFARL